MKTKKMNKVALFSLCAMFVACSDYDPANLSVQQAQKINEYSKNFVAQYGTIDPNHTWGFGSIPSMSTRAELARTEDENGNHNYNPPAPIDKEGDDCEYKKVLEAFEEATESDDVYFIWGTYYVQNVHSGENVDQVYFAARNYRMPSRDNKPNYSKTSDENSSGLNSKNILSEENESLYRDSENGNSFTMFAGMGYDSEDENPQFKCVDENGDDLENCQYIILLIDGSFYVGFDLDGDGNYSDWIVKIIPAGNRQGSVRIMCEDLGSTYDFDFNDIVFDVDLDTYVEDKNDKGETTYEVTITVQAAGGTLPVYIGNPYDPRNEVHAILGQSTQTPTNKPINVGVYASVPARVHTIKNLKSNKPEDIKLYRINEEDNQHGKEAEKTPVSYTELPSNNTGSVPFKICVPVDTKWTKEFKNIAGAYAGFPQWVESENGEAGFNNKNSWTSGNVNETYLMPANPKND